MKGLLLLGLLATALCSNSSDDTNTSVTLSTAANTTNTTTDINTTTATSKPVAIPKVSKKYDSQIVLVCVVVVVIFALMFDFSNGFHDTANSVATCVGTRSFIVPKLLTRWHCMKRYDVEGADRERLRTLLTAIFAAIFNFLPAFVQPLAVANAISKVIDIAHFPDGTFVPLGVLATYATLIAAIFWNFLTWNYGFPSSSSHALIGALVGAGLAVHGIPAVSWPQLVNIVYALLGSPAYAGIVGLVGMWLLNGAIQLCLKARKFEECDRDHWVYRFLVVASTAALGWLHGANDAQKTMGIIAATLLSAGYVGMVGENIDTPIWVVFACQIVIGIGTLMGGWSIIGKMAFDIYPRMQRTSALASNVGAIAALETTTYLGLPVSTTHAVNSAIVAAGVADGGVHSVRWKVMGTMLVCWVCTIPVAIFLGFALASLMILPGAWSAFFCIFFGVGLLAFMLFCMYKQRKGRELAALKSADKYGFLPSKDSDPAEIGLTSAKPSKASPPGTPHQTAVTLNQKVGEANATNAPPEETVQP